MSAYIQEIAGIGARPTKDGVRYPSVRELEQRSSLVKERSLINTSELSEGELLVQLIGERYKLLSEFYPEIREYRQGFEMAQDALFKGLHTANGIGVFTKLIDPKLNLIARTILKAKTMVSPASKYFTWEEKARIPGAIGDPFIPQRDCTKEIQYPPANAPSAAFSAYHYQIEKCNAENKWREILNQHFEKSAHHPLYNFITENDAAKLAPSKSGKPILHALAIDRISSLSKIGRSFIAEWQTNGIMRSNAEKGAGPLGPQKSIGALQQAHIEKISGGTQIGTLFGLEVAVVIKIITAVAAAISASAAFLQAMKSKQPNAAQIFENQLAGWGGTGYSAGSGDWLIDLADIDQDGSLSDSEITSFALPVGLGAAGLLLVLGGMNSRK